MLILSCIVSSHIGYRICENLVTRIYFVRVVDIVLFVDSPSRPPNQINHCAYFVEVVPSRLLSIIRVSALVVLLRLRDYRQYPYGEIHTTQVVAELVAPHEPLSHLRELQPKVPQ